MPSCRGSLGPGLSALALSLVALTGGCEIIFPEDCPDLDEVCPDVQCDNYKQNRDGCSICECEGEDEEPTVCWDDSECGGGERCDTVSFCEPAPGCDADGPCPDACYGRCVPAPSTCFSDADCAPGQICALYDNARPAPPANGDAEEPGLVAPQGVCVDGGCASADVALPECPPGTELVFDPSIDPCNAVCVAVDPCRDLLPEECALKPGCAVVEEPCGCGPNEPCDCAFIERCVSTCASLPVEQCESDPACVLIPAGTSGGGSSGSGGAEEPPQGDPCVPEDPNCGGAAPPFPSDLVCVPRSSDGTCFSDFDCLAGEICQPTTVCGSGCAVDENGNETCFEECWTERGVCIPSADSCFNLPADACAADPRCELVDGTFCQPVSDACLSDAECAEGQHCEVVETCPPCDPSNGDDLNCLAPCFIDGRCVDGTPPPASCNVDVDCAEGEACVVVTVCETCEASPDPGLIAPPPCDPICREEGVCTPIAPTPTLCQEDAQCAAGERCATELDHCLQNPDDPNGGCWTVCVEDRPPSDGTYCLDDSACGTGFCVFHADVCLDDPNSDLAVCSGWCADACAEVETPASDPATGACVTFPDSCIPPGWTPGC